MSQDIASAIRFPTETWLVVTMKTVPTSGFITLAWVFSTSEGKMVLSTLLGKYEKAWKK